jgi:hypothetical protein
MKNSATFTICIAVFTFIVSLVIVDRLHQYASNTNFEYVFTTFTNRIFNSKNHVVLPKIDNNNTDAKFYREEYTFRKYKKESILRNLSSTPKQIVHTKSSVATVTEAGSGTASAKKTTVFYAIGDQPYKPAHFRKMKQHISALPSNDGKFLIHVGDILDSKGKQCTQNEFSSVSTLLQSSPLPVFIIRKLCINYRFFLRSFTIF